uniref:Uncharacterized protein n=1 Tax=Magallana gigas TaxID=29159 RepID=A0A8W8KT16_MAGGI
VLRFSGRGKKVLGIRGTMELAMVPIKRMEAVENPVGGTRIDMQQNMVEKEDTGIAEGNTQNMTM